MISILSLLSILAMPVFAGWEYINPSWLSPGTYRIKSDHIVVTPLLSNGKLLIAVGGTGSQTDEFRNVLIWAEKKGYHVISVDYPNGIISTICQPKADHNCFDNYRNEIVNGNPVSDLVNVNKTNSLTERIRELLRHLSVRPGWNAFFAGDVQWSKVVLIGHSQGAGHVSYLSKMYPVKKVIMTGGPHDQYKDGVIAPWVLRPGRTDGKKYFALLHLNDFFGTVEALATNRALIGDQSAVVTEFYDRIPAAPSQIMMTNYPFRDPHNSLTNPVFHDVWDLLLN